MKKKLLSYVRRQLLSAVNRRILRSQLAKAPLDGRVPVFFVFFVFTPDLVHMAPFCIAGVREDFAPVMILNAVSNEDRVWMNHKVPVVRRIVLC